MAESRTTHSGGAPDDSKQYKINVAGLGLEDGTYKFTATVGANGYTESDKSNEIELVVSNGNVSHSGGSAQ